MPQSFHIEPLDCRILFSAILQFDGTMRVDGGSSDDKIIITRDAEDERLLNVNFNGGVESFRRNDIDQIIVEARDGDDRIIVGRNIDIPAMLSGGNGEDELRGGLGDDILLGGDDGDLLFGRGGHNLLIGGGGIDDLLGRRRSNIFVQQGNIDGLEHLEVRIEELLRRRDDRFDRSGGFNRIEPPLGLPQVDNSQRLDLYR